MMAEIPAAIQCLWERLSRVRTFIFSASNGEGSTTDWNGRGEGDVQVSDHHGGWLFSEQGRYITPHGRTLTMSNRFWWQRSERGIRLAHLRYDTAVELFELLPQGEGRWITTEPHRCGADHYRAELIETERGFLLDWQISGPRKNERLSYRYGE
ncbi:MAG: DUF6314 family protein [Aeromonas sp.]